MGQHICLHFTFLAIRAHELCESRGGRPGLPVPDSPYGLCEHKATLNLNLLLDITGLLP